MKNVTITTMIRTDGAETVFGIYHAKLRFKNGRPADVDLHNAKLAGTVKKIVKKGEYQDYYKKAKEFATEEYPAFDWRHP